MIQISYLIKFTYYYYHERIYSYDICIIFDRRHLRSLTGIITITDIVSTTFSAVNDINCLYGTATAATSLTLTAWSVS